MVHNLPLFCVVDWKVELLGRVEVHNISSLCVVDRRLRALQVVQRVKRGMAFAGFADSDNLIIALF